MITVIQLVSQAQISVAGHIISSIERGLVVFVGIEKTDTLREGMKVIDRILNYRIFPDADGKMNVSLKTLEGGLLLVPQFTLVAETKTGTRPGFSRGMPPEDSKRLFEDLVDETKKQYAHVGKGQFGAHMQISLCNEGPVTFIL